MNLFKSISVYLCALVLSTSALADDPSWPQFLGPIGDSESKKSTPLTSWDKSNFVWETDIQGTGWSSPVYADGRIWLTTATTTTASKERLEEKRRGVKHAQIKTTVGELNVFAICVDLQSGEILHNIKLATIADPGLINPLNSYASPTPAIKDGKVICHFGNYGTWCLDAKTGKEIWTAKYEIDHSMGPGSSPIIHDGRVLLVCDGVDQQYVASVNLSSGQEIWKTKRPSFKTDDGEHRKAYSTPLIAKIDGKEQAIIPGSQWLVSYDPETGKENWRAEHGSGFSVTPMASMENGLVIFATGYMRSEFVAVDPTGSGDVTQSHIKWRNQKAPHMPSMVSTAGKIFAVSDKGILSCIDAATGELLKRRRVSGNYSATPLLAGGNLYLSSRDGNVWVIKCDESLEEVGNYKFDAQLMATPATIGNDLLIRTAKKLYRIGNKKG